MPVAPLYATLYQGVVNTDRFRLALMDRVASSRLPALYLDMGLKECAPKVDAIDPVAAFFLAVIDYQDSIRPDEKTQEETSCPSSDIANELVASI